MNKTWIHNDLVLKDRGRISSATPADSVSANVVVGALTAGLGVIAAAFCSYLLLQTNPLRSAELLSAKSPPPVLASVSRESMAKKLSAKQKRAMGAQVHFIAEKMKPYRVPLKEGHAIAKSIVEESYRNGFDPLFIAAVVFAESGFSKRALSPVGARGLMQLMPDTARYISRKTNADWKGQSALYNPAYNVELGTRYLHYLLRKYRGNATQSLIAYNWGPGNLNTALKHNGGVPEVSRRYVKKINHYHQLWNDDFKSNKIKYEFGALYHAIY